MKLHLEAIFLISCIAASSGGRDAPAQTQPDNSYSFSGLNSGVKLLPSAFMVHDFAWSAVNVNASSITVRNTLAKSGYQFTHPDDKGGLFCGPNNSYTYPDTPLSPYGTYAWNVLNVSVKGSPPRLLNATLTVESLGGQDFYIFPPSTFSAQGGSSSSACDAYYNAWQGAAWSIPWFWDGTASVLVSPYANGWHNHGWWDKGWNTSLSIYNGGNQSVQYDINYISSLNYGIPVMRNPSSCSSTTNLNQSRTETIGASGSWSGNLTNDIFNPTSGWTVQEDGFIYIALNPVIPGTTPSSNVSPHSSGTAGCYPDCPLIETCHW